MSETFKAGQIVYILSEGVGSKAGSCLYEVEIVSLSGSLLCELRVVGDEQIFVGDVRTLFNSKIEAINFLINELQEQVKEEIDLHAD